MTDSPVASPVPSERRHLPRRWRRAKRALIGLVTLIALAGIGTMGLRRMGGPQILSVAPSSAAVGDRITIEGLRFDTRLEGNVVFFGGVPGRMVEAGSERLIVEVPQTSDLQGPPRPVKITIEVDDKRSNEFPFTLHPAREPEPGTEPQAEDAPPLEPPALPAPVTAPSPHRGN